jgi:hypothetical protein
MRRLGQTALVTDVTSVTAVTNVKSNYSFTVLAYLWVKHFFVFNGLLGNNQPIIITIRRTYW